MWQWPLLWPGLHGCCNSLVNNILCSPLVCVIYNPKQHFIGRSTEAANEQ